MVKQILGTLSAKIKIAHGFFSDEYRSGSGDAATLGCLKRLSYSRWQREPSGADGAARALIRLRVTAEFTRLRYDGSCPTLGRRRERLCADYSGAK